ncbi:hypothetical protein GBF35_25575 [Nonomuraea phyllanthi]|uniref:hypothetical protein n=1 Tax=Nonomuraea phyllanthi TaxID=2219224 RepID=UPI0012930091|nr:hypothetical protein [Nonomuraea phyllanthi]QFY09571.1 hypothetical protein GBF35_25575 [Nonomuraea phyllanthi]
MTRPPNPATKTGRIRIAQQARRHGFSHFREEFEVGVKCPLCNETVRGAEPRGRQTYIQVLDALMYDHLLRYCPKGPQQ